MAAVADFATANCFLSDASSFVVSWREAVLASYAAGAVPGAKYRASAACGRAVPAVEQQPPVRTWQPHRAQTPVNKIRWNHSCQVVVSGADDGTIAMTHHTGAVLGTLPTPDDVVTEPEHVRALSFSSGSRYLCSGGSSADASRRESEKR
jgi:hypothetical protein